jgi:hypothetical protein
MARRANPAFAVGAVVVPLVVLVAASTVGTVQHHTYAHVMAGVLWTGIDLFMALVLGPVLGGLAISERANVFRRFTPKMTFLMPSLALVTIAGGITLALRVGVFPNADPWLAILTGATLVPALALVGWQFDALADWRFLVPFCAAVLGSGAWLGLTLSEFAMTSTVMLVTLAIVTVLSVLGFGVLLPGEVRIYREMTGEDPDEDVISAIGMRNARLAGVQGVFQLAIVLVMVSLRYGGL